MKLTAVYANVSCRNPERSIAWYSALFDRAPDAQPMQGLSEWHWQGAGFQLFVNPGHAGHCTLTLFVHDLQAEAARFKSSLITPAPIEQADYVDIMRLLDPDENLVVLAEKR
ncbi:MAG: glyoxalase/bleomycin resistance/dioxygenase family protein [Rickettsiales bacterium]|nr:glyoxalase/bleomycin resistance/dioxygenase family protein [Rickettsiales bacterium]|tara:strand:+ start:191 stop:526 length:336 start_codon:yes stop_codon:yes gene_type:complete